MTSRLQEFGRFLSRMVMPNISAFIAWGLITAIFNKSGWFPNEELSKIIAPMIMYALPMLIAYTGGKAVDGTRGGVVGVVATMGLIVGSDIPMLMGAMLVGPLSGWLILKVDNLFKHHIPTGFEMLTSNFSAGILAAALAIIAHQIVGPSVEFLNGILEQGVHTVVDHGLLFLSALFIETGKVLFLNNAINHGILGPLGMKDALDLGKSVFFLLETNPGPGFGVLIAYWVYGKGTIKQSAPSAMIIHFFGGIHEIYFPYVLMNPLLFISVIFGGMSGIFTFQLLGAGLFATPSPGSIFAIFALAPKSSYLAVLLGIVISTSVSFIISGIILSRKSDWDSKDELEDQKPLINHTLKHYSGDFFVSKITFACDAGMGSSAMGASLFGKLLLKNGIELPIENVSIDAIPSNAEVVITYIDLIGRARKAAPYALHVGIGDFLDKSAFQNIIDILVENFEIVEVNQMKTVPTEILMKSNIVLNRATCSKTEAIIHAGRLLCDSGYVEESYIEGMLAREEKFSTYIGNGVAIPHGENNVKDRILSSGIVVVQYPEGVDFGEGKLTNLVIGIAGKGNEHIQILSNIAEAIEEDAVLAKLLQSDDAGEIYNILSSEVK